MIYEYEDVEQSEKRMMNLWNVFMRNCGSDREFRGQGCFGAYLFPAKLLKFVITHRTLISNENLRMAFLGHLMTMWEFGSIEAKCIQECMNIVDCDTYPPLQETQDSSLSQNRYPESMLVDYEMANNVHD